MKYSRNQFSPLRSFKRCPIGAFAALFVAAVAHGQDMAPAYTPGSISRRGANTALQGVQSDAFELEDWAPPLTNVQTLAPSSDWSPPVTNVTPSFPTLSQDPEPRIEAPSLGSSSKDSSIIQPPNAIPEPIVQAPNDQTLVPFSDIEQSGASPKNALPVTTGPAEAPLVETSEGVAALNTSPAIPPTVALTGDDLIEFDGDCLDCEQSNEGGPAGADGGIGRSLVNENIGTRAEAVLGRARGGGLQTDPQLFTPVRNVLGTLNQGLAGNEAVHAVGQLSFLSLSRDYRGRGRQLSSGVPNLFANGPDEGNFTGVDLSYGRRRSGGQGWDMRYIGFNPGQASDVAGGPSLVWGGFAPPLNDPAIFGGALNPNIPQTFGLSGIGLNGVSAADVFGSALNHRVTRDSEFGSFEVNALRATSGSTRASSGDAVVELFAGLRGVSFQETTTFSAAAIQTPGFPNSALYASEVENSLFGIQIGGRLERGLGKGWGFTFGSRVGIYNNRVESRQRAEFGFADGRRATPILGFGDNAGEEFDFDGKDNELAFLGELDFGVTYQFRQFTRAKVGFRGIAVTNVATAAGQFEDSLFDVDVISQPQAFGDLIVGGLYFGVDHAF